MIRLWISSLLLVALSAYGADKAVLIYPVEKAVGDASMFYTSHQMGIIKNISSLYTTSIYSSVRSDAELFSIDISNAKLIVLSGHGTQLEMLFGESDARNQCMDDLCKSRNYVSIADIHKFTLWLESADPQAVIVLQSCFTGAGRDGEFNFARMVKMAAGPTRTVYAARGTVPYNGLSINPPAVTFRCENPILPFIHQLDYNCTVRL